MGEGAGEGMAKALFVESEEAVAGDAQVLADFGGGIDFGGLQIAAVDEVMNGMAGDGEEGGDLANFDEGGNGLFFQNVTICNHKMDFLRF
jgi:hypothetical protein